jgi:hypothetical protein
MVMLPMRPMTQPWTMLGTTSTAEQENSMTTWNAAAPGAAETDEVTCKAMHLAQAATRLTIAWHARILDSDAAMTCLQEIVTEIARTPTSEPEALLAG